MSTAPEVLVATHCGMRVFGLSLITNKVVKSYEDNESVNHEAVLEVSKMRSETLQALVTELISAWTSTTTPHDVFNTVTANQNLIQEHLQLYYDHVFHFFILFNNTF